MASDETKILYTLLSVAIALALIVLNFLRSNLRQQRRHGQLQQEKTEIEITTLEHERVRVAQDLHDGVAPVLTAIKMQLEDIEPKNAKEIHAVTRSKSLLQDVIQQIRVTSNDLSPNLLNHIGLLEAMKDFASTIEETGKLKIQIEASPKHIDLLPEKEIHLFRIFQEALHNCLRHGRAKNFRVNIIKRKKVLELIMQDDGVGFDYDQMKKHDLGYGLKNITNRVDLLDGSFFVEARPGKGVKYTFVFSATFCI